MLSRTLRTFSVVLAAVALSASGLAPTVEVASASEPPPTFGTRVDLVGGKLGWSGPASRAQFSSISGTDVAADGSLLVSGAYGVVRVDVDADRLTAVQTESAQPQDVVGTAAGVVVAVPGAVRLVLPDGSNRTLYNESVLAIDAGADDVVWFATAKGIGRILSDGTVAQVYNSFNDIIDFAVSPDGTTAYVLDSGYLRYGVYAVTAGGGVTRVAGNLNGSSGPTPGTNPLDAATGTATGIATDGVDVFVGDRWNERIVAFRPGGLVRAVATGTRCVERLSAGADSLIASCSGQDAVRRFSTSGADLGRVVGIDPAQPWSPDGVLARDSYTGDVRGAAALPDGRIIFSTVWGLVREVGLDGRLRTRARLDPLRTRGKVAIGADGTAYVVTDGGALMSVPASGTPARVPVDGDVTDVEVTAAGRLVVADARHGRVLSITTAGADAIILASGLPSPTDLALDGDATLVLAGGGIQRILPDGQVLPVLGRASESRLVTRTAEGVWFGGNPFMGGWAVLRQDGSVGTVRADSGPIVQGQALTDGSVLIAGGDTVRRLPDAGLTPAPAPIPVTARGAAGRIVLDFDAQVYRQVHIVAKRGPVAPAEPWDGFPVGSVQQVLLIDGKPVVPGEQWSFAVFGVDLAPVAQNRGGYTWTAPMTATASALVDSTAPPVPSDLAYDVTQSRIGIGFSTGAVDDLDYASIRMSIGSVPPATPNAGTELARTSYGGTWTEAVAGSVPSPLRGQDYAISVFLVDYQGNVTRSSRVVHLDFDAPGPVETLSVSPSYTSAAVTYTPPTDTDFEDVLFAVTPGDSIPSLAAASRIVGAFGAYGLSMDSDYTLAVWARDRNGNIGAPVLTRFRTLLDTQPPALATNVAVTGGLYRVAATWTPPSDRDLASVSVALVDLDTGTRTVAPGITKTSTSAAWGRLAGGHRYTVEVTGTDTQGLSSVATSEPTLTDPDSNGPPPAIDPSSVTLTPLSSRTVSVTFPRPAIDDLKSVAYGIVPADAPADTVGTLHPISTTQPTMTQVVTLPEALKRYRLSLWVWDYNANRVVSTIGEVSGVANASELPGTPNVSVSAQSDNRLDVQWAVPTGTGAATSWTVKAVAGATTRSLTVDGAARSVAFTDVIGRQQWTVTVQGANALGQGAVSPGATALVADSTAPAVPRSLTALPAYDAVKLVWVNPTAFDFDRVEVIRKGATAAETVRVYTGKSQAVVAGGLVAGRTYAFEVRAFDRLGNASAAATVKVRQSTLSVTSATIVRYGTTTRVSGVLAQGGAGVAGRTVSLFAQPSGSTAWTRVSGVVTSSTGGYSFTVKPGVTTRYRVGYLGTGATGGAYSAVRSVSVAPVTTMRLSRSTVTRGGTVTFSTVVAPNHSGRVVQLQRWSGTAWVQVSSRTLSSTSGASVSLTLTTRGRWSYRWVLAAHADHAAGVSATGIVTVS